MPMNSVSARSSCEDSSARWPSIECIRGRTTPPRTMSSIPSRSSRTLATSSALVMTVRRRSAISRAKARAVEPLPIAIVVSSVTRCAAARAMARLASRCGSRPIEAAEPGLSAAPPYVRTSRPSRARRWRSRRIVDGVTPRSSASSATLARPPAAELLDQARATLRLPHARILRKRARIVNAGARTAHRGHLRARKLRTDTRRRLRCRRWPTCLASFAAWTRAARRAAPSPCWPSTIARTCARSCARRTPGR